MAYADVTVIVDGAVEQEATFHDYALQDDFIAGVREDARGDGYPTEVYIVNHDHDDADGDGCGCVQYLTDHKPAYAWNMDGPGTGFEESDPVPAGDSAKIRDACLAARDSGDVISDACARVIASQWHSGNMSVSFSSTGAVVADPDTVWREMFLPEYNGAAMTPEDRLAADSLRTYLEHAGERGPVAGWSGLWL